MPAPSPRETFVPLTIGRGVRTAALRDPSRVAIRFGERSLTYEALAERMRRVADGVAAAIPAGGHAALMAPNAPEFVELVCGAADGAVPLALVNPNLTHDEAAFVLADSEARLLFAHPDCAELARAAAPPQVERVIVLGEEYEAWLAAASDAPPTRPVAETDTFCIVYTSGTTGLPKGVELPHRSRTLIFAGMAAEYGCFTPGNRALAIAPLFFGGGLANALACVYHGGTLHLHAGFDPERVLRTLAEERITNVFMVPTHLKAIDDLGEAAIARHDLSALELVMSTGAALPQALKDKVVGWLGEGVLYEQYGSTEAGVITNLRPEDHARKRDCVGTPFPLTEIRICDEEGRDVAPGEAGELLSRSPYLFNGYWNREQETAAVLRDGWCRSGDVGRLDEEGYLHLVGRLGDKIISGGINVYPREIERALAQHAAVAEAVAFGVPDEHWGEVVHAAVTLHAGADASAQELLAFGAERLSRYKRPVAIDVLDALPRNAAGKILRRELRARHTPGAGS